MAELHHGTTLRPSKLELLTAWISSQRWYAAKGCTPQLTRLAAWRLREPGCRDPARWQDTLTAYLDLAVDAARRALEVR